MDPSGKKPSPPGNPPKADFSNVKRHRRRPTSPTCRAATRRRAHDAPSPRRPAPRRRARYTVASGDTLWAIAKKELGAGNAVARALREEPRRDRRQPRSDQARTGADHPRAAIQEVRNEAIATVGSCWPPPSWSSRSRARRTEPRPGASPRPPPPPPVAAVITVSGVELGSAIGADKRVTTATDVFKPADTIYAAVVTSGSAPRATITARFTFEDGQVVDESRQDVAGAGVTEFHISKPDGWPAGSYQLEVLLDGKSVATKAFEVKV